MSSSTQTALFRGAPILGAGLIVVALGSLVWALRSTEARRPGEPPVPIARGAPIRSAVPISPATDAPRLDAPAAAPSKDAPPPEFEELEFAALTAFDYPKSGSLQAAPVETTVSPRIAPPPPDPPTRIPAEVRALDGRRVLITGFMNPVEFDGDGVKSFSLTAIPGGCCFAAIPRLNEWIVVTMPGEERAEYAYYDPVTIFGTLSVGELYEDGIVLSLYRMTPEKIEIGY